MVQCWENGIQQLHSVCLVCSFQAGISKADREAISRVMKSFPSPNIVSILITRSENFPQEQKRKMKEEVVSVFPDLKDVFFFGALREEDYEAGLFDSVADQLRNVLKMREVFFQHVLGSQVVELDENPFFKKLKEAQKQEAPIREEQEQEISCRCSEERQEEEQQTIVSPVKLEARSVPQLPQVRSKGNVSRLLKLWEGGAKQPVLVEQETS